MWWHWRALSALGLVLWGAGCLSGTTGDGAVDDLEHDPADAESASDERTLRSGMCGAGASDDGAACSDPAAFAARASRVETRECQDKTPFGRQFLGSKATLRGFAVDTDGHAILAGTFEERLSIGGDRLRSAGTSDVFVAKLDTCGNPRWSRRFGDAARQRAIDVAASRAGHALVLGEFSGAVDFGAGRLTAASPSGTDLFLAKLDPKGRTRWVAQVSAEEDSILSGAALADDRDGGALLLGRLEGAARIAGARIARRALGAFVARIDASGRFSWVSTPPSGSDSEEIGIEIDASGNAILASQDARGTATFVTKLGPSGKLLWHRRFKGSSEQLEMAHDIAVTPEGAALLSGSGVFGEPALPGGPRAFVAKLDREGGVLWVKRFDDLGPRRVAAGAKRVLLAGPASCAGATVDDPARCSAFVVELGPSGEARWIRRFGADARVAGAKIDPWGHTMLAGSFKGTLDFGTGPLSSPQGALFVARLPPSF
jgi:hypothetical protein